MICNDCNKEFKHKNKRKEYCSKKCKDKSSYLRNKEKHLILVKKWQKNNPKKTKEYNKKTFSTYKKIDANNKRVVASQVFFFLKKE